jgi:hypothetical protein
MPLSPPSAPSSPKTSGSKPHSGHWSRDGVNIATFDELADAEVLKTILINDGIDAWVQDERRLQRYWFAAAPQAGIHLRVPEAMLEHAQQRLRTNSNAAIVLQRAVRCPSCWSYRIEYPAMTRKNALPTLVAQVAVALRFLKHECYCENCHYTWVRTLPAIDRK